jgi:hypothetical protein
LASLGAALAAPAPGVAGTSAAAGGAPGSTRAAVAGASVDFASLALALAPRAGVAPGGEFFDADMEAARVAPKAEREAWVAAGVPAVSVVSVASAVSAGAA